MNQLSLAGFLALSFLRQRIRSAVLEITMLALGVATIAVLMLVVSQLQSRGERDAAGIDLVIGAKGSPLQLVLSSVYHADFPTGNIALAEARMWAASPLVKLAVPIALGDSYRGKRMIGTDPSFDKLYGLDLATGQRARVPMHVTLGTNAARETGLTLGSRFAGQHGLTESGAAHGEALFEVVGVFAPTNTVVDHLIVTPLESVWAVHGQDRTEGHHHDDNEPGAEHGPHQRRVHASKVPLNPPKDSSAPTDPREVTAVLIQFATPLAAARLPRQINSQSALQAASPAQELARLFGFLGVGVTSLKAFAAALVLLSALGVFVSLGASFASRTTDLGLLRVMGATRGVVGLAVLLQGAMIGVAGVILGLAIGHMAVAVMGTEFAGPRGLALSGATWVHEEGWLALSAMATTLAAALTPAWRAYRKAVPWVA
jgi:putative ABC transport system permease protein